MDQGGDAGLVQVPNVGGGLPRLLASKLTHESFPAKNLTDTEGTAGT